MQQIAGSMGKHAAAWQQVNQATDQVSESTKNAADKTKELTQAMEENVGGSESLSAAMGKQSQQTEAAGKSLSSWVDTATKGVGAMGVLSAGLSGIATAAAAAEGVFNLFTGGISAGIGIIKGAVGVVGGFFSGLMGAARDYHNKTAGEMHQANETIRKEFGDITTDQGKFVKDMAGDLGTAQKALGSAGGSLFASIGNKAAVLAEMGAMAGEFGDSLVRMQGQIGGATSELLLMRKGMNISTEAFKNMASSAEASGGTLQDALTETMVASAHLSKTFGVDVKVIGKNIDKMAKDMGSFGSMAPKSLAAVATYAVKLGVSIESLKGTMDAFDTFEGAAANAGKLAEAFGMNVDVMGMMNEENPAERMDMLRKSFEETGRSVNDLSRHEMKLLSESMGGLPVDEMKNALSMSTDEMGFGDFESAAEEAAEKMTPEQAMQDVAKSIDKLAQKLTDMTGGPLSEFLSGFMKVINRSPEMIALLGVVKTWLRTFFKAGKEVAKLFLTMLRAGGPLKDMLGSLNDLFSLKRIEKFHLTVQKAFGDFFKMLKSDPKKAVENLFDDLMGAFKSWFAGSGDATKGLAQGLKDLLIMGLKLVAGLAPKIIKEAAKYIREFAVSLKDFLSGDKDTAAEMGKGIGDAFTLAFQSIKEVIPELLSALLDLFKVLFEVAKPHLIKVIGVVIAAILIKTLVSAFLAVGISGLVGGALKKMLGALSKLGTGKDTKSVKKMGGSATSSGKTAVGGIGSLLDALKQITIGDILKGGLILVALAVFSGISMYIFAKALVKVSSIMRPISWNDLGKALLGMLGAVLVTIPLIYAGSMLGSSVSAIGVAVIGMLAAALMFVVGGVALGYALQLIVPIWSKLDFKETAKVLALMTLTSIAMIPLILAGTLMGALGVGIGLTAIGMLAAAVLFSVAAAGLGYAMQKHVIPAWEGVDAMGALKALALMALVAIALIPMIAGGTLLGLAVLATGGGALVLIENGFMLGAEVMQAACRTFPDALISFGEAFKNVKLAPLGKAMLALLATVVITAGIVYFGAALAIYGLGLILAIVGLKAGAYFLEEATPYIQQMVEQLDTIKIDNPKKFREKMLAIGAVIGAVADIAALGISAMSMATTASLFSDSGPADMMLAISGFIGTVLTSMISFITDLVALASKFDEKSLKGAEAIAGILGAVGTLAGALMEPLQNVQANVGIIDIMNGDTASKQLETMAAGMGTILEKLAEHVPKIITALIGAMSEITDPEMFSKKAAGLKDIFLGVLALMQVVKEMNEMGQGDKAGWFTGTEFKKEIITQQFANVSAVLASTELKTMMNDAVTLVSAIPSGDELLAKAESFGGVLNSVMTITKSLSRFGTFLAEGGLLGIVQAKSLLEFMGLNSYMPSDIIYLIKDEANSLAVAMSDMQADLGTIDIRPTVEGILGFDGDRTFTIKPEAVNLTVRLAVKIDAEELAVAIAKGNEGLDGFFQTTAKAKKADLDIPGGI